MAGIGIGLALPFYQFLGAQGGSDPSKAIDDIIDAAGPSLYQFNDASTYDAAVWPDSSGNGRTMLDVDQSPTTTTLFGRPALNFEGNSSIQRLQATAPATDYQPFADQSARGIIYVVAKDDGVKGTGDIINTALGASWTGYRVLMPAANTTTAQSYNGSGSVASPSVSGISTGGFLKIQQGNGASQSLTYEGDAGNDVSSTTTDGTPYAAATQTLSIGGYPNTNQSLQFAGDISAVILLLNPTPEQEAAVEVVLRREYLGQGAIQSLGPAVYLDAGEGITLNGSDVSAWEDQSGWGNDVEQGTVSSQPLFVASGINGQPSLDFSGSTVIGRSTYTQGDLPIDSEVFAVHREVTPPGTNAMVVGSGSANQRLDIRYTVSSGGVYQTVGTGTGVQTTTTNWVNGEDVIAHAGGGASGFLNRTSSSSQTTESIGQISTTGMTGVSVGNYYTGASQENDGLIAEVIIFPRRTHRRGTCSGSELPEQQVFNCRRLLG